MNQYDRIYNIITDDQGLDEGVVKKAILALKQFGARPMARIRRGLTGTKAQRRKLGDTDKQRSKEIQTAAERESRGTGVVRTGDGPKSV